MLDINKFTINKIKHNNSLYLKFMYYNSIPTIKIKDVKIIFKNNNTGNFHFKIELPKNFKLIQNIQDLEKRVEDYMFLNKQFFSNIDGLDKISFKNLQFSSLEETTDKFLLITSCSEKDYFKIINNSIYNIELSIIGVWISDGLYGITYYSSIDI